MTVLQSDTDVPDYKVSSIDDLELPQSWERKIFQIIEENKMLYELHAESAKDFKQLRERLKSRGFKNVQMAPSLMLDMKAYSMSPVANTRSNNVKKTMIRKKK